MNIKEVKIQGILIIEPDVFKDERGFFLETWNKERYEKNGIRYSFVQDNISFSKKGILRGLHFQYPQPQGKLIHVLSGQVIDIAVDIRIGSPTYGQWHSEIISDTNLKQMFVPPGFAHGYCVMSESAVFLYKCTDFYNPATEHGIIWNDPELNIDWHINEPTLSSKDAKYPRLKELSHDELPRFEGI